MPTLFDKLSMEKQNFCHGVSVISCVDPLEIYTDREGEVIFKKYSPIGELSAFAMQYAETLHKVCSLSVIICDRDSIIACSGVPRKDFAEKSLCTELEHFMEGRSLYSYREGAPLNAVNDNNLFFVKFAMPIVSEGDVVGCVASLYETGKAEKTSLTEEEVEIKLIMTAAGFLGRQLEN